MEKRSHFADITPTERALLSRLRECPALYLGTSSLRDFGHMSGGYQFAMQTAGLREQHNLLPDGLNEFTARYYGERLSGLSAFSLITRHTGDDAEALKQFFTILDAYLINLGYAPIGKENRHE